MYVCGFEEFTPSGNPKRYKHRSVTGNLHVRELATGTDCTALYPGSGQQQGTWPVFFFFNEFVDGSVTVSIEDVDLVNGRIQYKLAAAQWVAQADPPGYVGTMSTHNWRIQITGQGVVGVNYTWWQNINTNFTVSIEIEALFGYGVGAWTYTAGNWHYDDEWDYDEEYNADCSDWAVYQHNSKRRDYPEDTEAGPIGGVEYVPIPTYFSGQAAALAAGRPDLFYQPWATLLVQMQPQYTEVSVDPTHRITEGLACVVGTGFGAASMESSGTLTEALTEEFSAEDAIAAFQEANPWSGISWAACAGKPCCMSEWGALSGVSFAYAEAKARISISALEPDKTTVVEVYIMRQNILTGTVQQDRIEEFSDVSDSGGNFTVIEFDIPQEEGYRFWIGDVRIYSF